MKDIIKTIGSWIAALCAAMIVLIVFYVCLVLGPEEDAAKARKDCIECRCKKHHGSNIGVQLSTNPTYKWHPSNVYHH